ncbi:MAG: hypothetical protein NTZ05_06435, partial [Chloroflexi bacterium]|nr:hypothetical protein [Chloroflexota bacterium]
MAHLFIATVDALMVPYRSVNGVVLAGLPGQAFPLVVGANTVEVRVTAPDLITAKISTITVTRLAANPLP